MILALDLGSTVTGFAVGQAFTVHGSGYWNIKSSRYEDLGVRPVRLKRHLERMHALWNFHEIAYEAVKFSSTTYSSQLYGVMWGTMMVFAKEHDIPYVGVDISSWKKELVGRGNASKEDVRLEVNRRTGKQVDVHDESDAIGVLIYQFIRG